MEVVVSRGMDWLGHKEGAKLNIADSYAEILIGRGVVERVKQLIRPDHDKQIKGSDNRK